MRLTIPVSPDTIPHLPALLKMLSTSTPGEGHQLYILTAAECLPVAEKFSADARLKTKFGGVTLSSASMSLMAHPHNFLWVTYFRNPHPDTLWLDPGAAIVGGPGWLSRIEDSLRFATSLLIGAQNLHTTGVYRSGAFKRLRAWECPCFRGISPPVHLAHGSQLIPFHRESSLFYCSDTAVDAPPPVEVVIPRTWGRAVTLVPLTETPRDRTYLPPVEVTEVVTPEVSPEVSPEVVKVDTEPKTEVIATASPRVVRRAKS